MEQFIIVLMLGFICGWVARSMALFYEGKPWDNTYQMLKDVTRQKVESRRAGGQK